MVIDDKEQQAFLLEVLKLVKVPWEHIDVAARVKRAVETASVMTDRDETSTE